MMILNSHGPALRKRADNSLGTARLTVGARAGKAARKGCKSW